MDRSTGTPVGFALLLLFAIGFGWVLLGRDEHSGGPLLASFSTSQVDRTQEALVWPDQMPGPITAYEGRRVSAFGLTVTGVDADEGFWVTKGGRSAWIQLQTATESPYTVRPGDVVSLSGRVVPHNPNFPSQIFFCADRQASAGRLSQEPEHFAVLVNALSFGMG